MRSKMAPDLAGRCPQCYLRQRYCGCEAVTQVPTRTGVLVIRHVRESYKSTNSVRWAGLALSNCRILDYGGRSGLPLLPGDLDGAWLVFPGPASTASELSGAPPKQLVFLDGTWRQTRRMLSHLPALQTLPRLALEQLRPAGPRLRARRDPRQLTTLEAMAFALGAWEGEPVTQALLAVHRRMVEGVQRGRGTWRAGPQAQDVAKGPPAQSA